VSLAALALTGLACAGPSPGPASSPAPAPARVAAAPGKPLPAVQLALAFRPDRFRPGEEVDLEATVAALADIARVRITLRLPPEIRLAGSPAWWEGPVPAGARRTLAFRVVVARTGRLELGATAEVLDGPYAGQVSGAVLSLDAAAGEVRWR
jgi:hypothetical protein